MTKRFTKERREHIHDLILERKRVTVKQLSEELDVSEVTLRTDLKEMEKEGLLTRTHGGAIMKEPTTPTGSFKKRSETNLKEKQIIAKRALSLIEDKSCILLDASTTALELAKEMKNLNMKLTIMTNGMSSAIELKENPYFNVILIGGILRPGSMALEGSVGIQAMDMLNNIDLLFTSSSGFSCESGLTDFNFYETDLKKNMVKRAKHVVALLDHSKFNTNSISSFATLEEIDTIITDHVVDEATAEKIKTANVHLIDH
jgi:DeoR/GlpR family transcriptional regulator of sugar metabolism